MQVDYALSILKIFWIILKTDFAKKKNAISDALNQNVSSAACPPGARTEDTSGRCCVFPFKYKGRTYNSCTNKHSFRRKWWCSFDTVYKDDWDYCGKDKCNFSWDVHVSIFLFPLFSILITSSKKICFKWVITWFTSTPAACCSFYIISKQGKNPLMKELQFFLIVFACRWWSV